MLQSTLHCNVKASFTYFCAVMLTLACHRQGIVSEAPYERVPSSWTYCWWTLLLTELPPDSVVARFNRAYVATGQLHATSTQHGDTAWTRAGPTPFEVDSSHATYWSRVVAFRQNDTTRFRYYVAIMPPSREWRQAADSSEANSNNIPICARIAKAAAIPTWVPRRDPNWEDSLTVWDRIQ
jgi:hypothetical protein